MKKIALWISLGLWAVSCGKNKEQEPDAIARVNDSYLYAKDIQGIVPDQSSPEDSLAIVANYLSHWATQRLLLDAAEVNLSDEKKEEIAELVKQFKTDLLTSAYLERLVQQTVDTTVSESDLKLFYTDNKDKFVSNEILVQLRYVNVLNENPKLDLIKKYFLSDKKQDFKKLEDLSLQLKSYALNDSVWVNGKQVFEKLPFVGPENAKSYLSNGQSYEVKDEKSTYMVKVFRVRDKNSIAPYSYIRPTLVQMMINNRKMELIKKIQKDILDDANKNNRYEIYN